ncbi:MAG: B12-binding domain-containing radical SAM protein [Candidatus Helarchaeota archaeon]
MIDVLLIHPPVDIEPKNVLKSLISPYLVGYGLLHIASYLKKMGYKVEVWNIPVAYAYGYNLEDIKALIKYHDPKLVGIELNWLHFSNGSMGLVKIIKKINPNIKIILGGVHATIFAEEIIKNYPLIDAIFIGESEATILDYIQNLEKGLPLTEVPSCYIRNNDKIILNKNRKVLPIDEIPPYSLSIVKPKQKESFNIGTINTTRGPCSGICPYCIGSRKNYPLMIGSREKLELHSPEWILEQLELLIKDTHNIAIQDYIYCAPKKHIMEIFNFLKNEKITGLIEYFNIAGKPNSFDKETLSLMAKTGVDNIDYGVETGSNSTLKILRRGYTAQQAVDTIDLTVKCGILPKTYWMVGLPDEKDLSETKNLIKQTIEKGGFPRWVTPLIILPGTELFREAIKYHISIKMNTYNDFMKFSTTKINKNAWYPDVITHTTNFMEINDILKATNDLKDYILSFKEKIMSIFQKNLQQYFNLHENVTSSLIMLRMKRILSTLKYTLF